MPRSLASLGALLVVASLPFSLFFQQAVTYQERWTSFVGANGTLPRVITYENSQLPYIVNGTNRLDGDDFLESAVLPFIYGNGTEIDIGVKCPTGNCTWPPYESLAVCGTCANVAKLLTYACLNSPGDWLSNVTKIYLNDSAYPSVSTCGFYLNVTEPSPILMNGYVNGPNGPGEALSLRMLPLTDTSVRTQYYGSGSINFKDIRNPIVDFIAVGTGGGASAVYLNTTPEAHECVLNWCTKTFEPTYQWGQLNENPSNVFYDTGPPYNPWQPRINSVGVHVVDYLANFTLKPPYQHPPWANITYGLSNMTAVEAILLFDPILPAYVTSNITSNPTLRGWNAMYEQASGGMRTRTLPFNPWVPPNNITNHIERLATVMSRSIRAHSIKKEIVAGESIIDETYVRVRWAWISLPVIILITSLIFLAATIVKSSSEQNEIGIWKTSSLATLMHGLNEPVQKSVGPLRRMRDVRSAAKNLRMSIVPD